MTQLSCLRKTSSLNQNRLNQVSLMNYYSRNIILCYHYDRILCLGRKELSSLKNLLIAINHIPSWLSIINSNVKQSSVSRIFNFFFCLVIWNVVFAISVTKLSWLLYPHSHPYCVLILWVFLGVPVPALAPRKDYKD